MRQFSDGCGLASQLVDNLLDILTDGRHRQARPRLDLYRQLAREERLVSAALAAALPTAGAPPPPQPDLMALRSLAKLGIDVGFVDALGEDGFVVGVVLGLCVIRLDSLP